MDIFGYFDQPGQTEPVYEPGFGAPCPICTLPVGRHVIGQNEIKTISLMKPGNNRSYFFRAHKNCWEGATDEERQHVEGLLIDERLGQED